VLKGANMSKKILTAENIILDVVIQNKWDAIRRSGELLVTNGYVEPGYVDDMIAREKSDSVYIGNHVAIPHGLADSESKIIESGISFLQIPEGVSFGKEKAYLVIGIAGKEVTHMEILGKIAMACSELEIVEELRTTTDKNRIIELIND
jgi:mannitol/fructose-specific phosphotransferase system IIA component